MIRTRRDTLKAVAVVAPSLAAVFVFVYGFILWSLRTSVSRWDVGALSPGDSAWLVISVPPAVGTAAKRGCSTFNFQPSTSKVES